MKIYVVEKYDGEYHGEDYGGYSFVCAYKTFEGALKYVQSTYKEHVNEDDVAYYHYIKSCKNGIEWDKVIHGIPDTGETDWIRVSCGYRLPWLTEDSSYIITKTDLIDE